MKPFIDPPGDTDILFVDDDAVVRSLYEKILTRAGYRVFTSADAKTGLQVMDRMAIPILITDIIMEEMDGIELITRIRKRHPQVRIIAITGGGAFDANECLRMATTLGAEQGLAKPFSADELLHAVGQFLPARPAKDI